ncbi:MAG: helix-turn-helix domain-containing protein [Desulfobacteraceae bacterium]|jgi:transcriptional regulator with XRE-family HTH domain|nr:helix-turn-helix domain-containing protein [Desulfobacteraceae bacterium]
MNITQAEMIQLLRRRTGMNQGDFGAKAFDTSYESGRTKVKNLELGKQKPTADDIEKMARILGVDKEDLKPAAYEQQGEDGIFVPREVLNRLAGFDAYLEMLVHSVRLEDEELVNYLCQKLSDLFAEEGRGEVRNAAKA